ncbi:hypothetical protein D3C80_2007060 [compost metagenome]
MLMAPYLNWIVIQMHQFNPAACFVGAEMRYANCGSDSKIREFHMLHFTLNHNVAMPQK